MVRSIATAGNSGPKVRSDCEITLEIKPEGGISISLLSKVKTLYGKSIISLIDEVLRFFGIENASVTINDSGALPYVIAARLEAAIKQICDSDKEFLPEFSSVNNYNSERYHIRFSRLYLPGNNPGFMINAGLHSADGIILDLEDSVAPEKKNEARILVRNALRAVNFCGAERMVRINQGEIGLKDLHSVIPHNVNLIIIPKCESADNIKSVEEEISLIRKELKLNLDLNLNQVYMMPVIESATGVEKCFEIAKASKNLVAMAIGLEDYTADLGVARTVEGKESFYARTRMIVACKSVGIQPIDSVFSDVADMEALKRNVLDSKALGFEGMGCIHPCQIPVIRSGFAPDETEIEKSKNIVVAFETARRNGLNVISLGSKMIDPPVVARAQKIIDLAVRMNLLSETWKADIPVKDN